MSINIIRFHHVNVTVAEKLEEAAKHFYGSVLGLKEIPKPVSSRARGGGWYELGTMQLHLSRENTEGVPESSRHICLLVEDLDRARLSLKSAGFEILPDSRPIPGWSRLYVRDPGGNLLEIAQQVS